MTTAASPLPVLRNQAERIARMLKAAERGEFVAAGVVKVGIVMDDKVITLALPWQSIRETDEAGVVEFILAYMRQERRMSQGRAR